MNKLDIVLSEGLAELVGPLNRQTIASLPKKAHQKITHNKTMIIDLKQVTDVDTAGLAWLLFLIEAAIKESCQLTFAHLPEDLLKLAKLSAVDDFLSSPSL